MLLASAGSGEYGRELECAAGRCVTCCVHCQQGCLQGPPGCLCQPCHPHCSNPQASSAGEGEQGTGTEPSPRASTEARSASLDRPLADALAPLVVDDSDGSSASGGAAAATPFAAAAAAAWPSGGGSGDRSGGGGERRRGLFGFVQRLFGALGGKEATETLVRTASFR